ncbi:MAG: hypothetical protein H6673_03300 [Anaerolineales bacterium]|nr:hypothetical protein [Anaerolineales bacterium]
MDEWRFFCLITSRVPVFEQPSLAHIALTLLQHTLAQHGAQLWGYVILPDSVQAVLETEHEAAYHHAIEAFKTASETAICEKIRADHPDLVDAITFYNPAWSKPVYLIWQGGYQTQLLPSAYALSNKIADLVQRPVELGLAATPADWPFSSYQPPE